MTCVVLKRGRVSSLCGLETALVEANAIRRGYQKVIII
jgi:hypothetical protein